MTCKDCAHYEACKMILLSAYPDVTEAEIIQTENNQTKCVNFKDKTRFVELPCKVGDIVYYITGIRHNLIKPAKIKEIVLDDSGVSYLYVQGDGVNFESTFDIFSLTPEEAEEKLERLKNENSNTFNKEYS